MAKFKAGDYFSIHFINDFGQLTSFVAVITVVYYERTEGEHNYRYDIMVDNSEEEIKAYHESMWNTFCFESRMETRAVLLNPRVAKLLYAPPDEQNGP